MGVSYRKQGGGGELHFRGHASVPAIAGTEGAASLDVVLHMSTS